MKELMMSKQDIKDENKNTEGDQDIKQKRKSIMKERLNSLMITKTKEADVVITNPTHYAVALEYTPSKYNAPRVIAKGSDLLALEIKKIAKAQNIPIVENKILARSLYESAELEVTIPAKYYSAVAKVISYVAGIKGAKYFENKKSNNK